MVLPVLVYNEYMSEIGKCPSGQRPSARHIVLVFHHGPPGPEILSVQKNYVMTAMRPPMKRASRSSGSW